MLVSILDMNYPSSQAASIPLLASFHQALLMLLDKTPTNYFHRPSRNQLPMYRFYQYRLVAFFLKVPRRQHFLKCALNPAGHQAELLALSPHQQDNIFLLLRVIFYACIIAVPSLQHDPYHQMSCFRHTFPR